MALKALGGSSPKPKKPAPVGSGVFKPGKMPDPIRAITTIPRKPARAPSPPRPVVSHAAVTRRAATHSVQRPAPAPKPPPVVVANNQGRVTKPSPPPPVRPGPIAAKKAAPKNPVLGAPKTMAQKQATGINGGNAPTPAPPQPPDINTWLGTDAEYQAAVQDYNSALADYNATYEGNVNSTTTSFAQRLRDLQTAQSNDQADLSEQFAGRGILKSGVYADALSGLNQQYDTSQSQLDADKQAALAQLSGGQTAFQGQGTQTLEQARLDAIARRAAQYGL